MSTKKCCECGAATHIDECAFCGSAKDISRHVVFDDDIPFCVGGGRWMYSYDICKKCGAGGKRKTLEELKRDGE